jgi:CheY-like chemotaxis protein
MSAHLLLLEPHGDTRDMYREFLQRYGFHVTPAAVVGDAAAAAPRADVIVTVVSVAGQGEGLAFVRWLRQNPETARKPVIITSSWTRDRDIAAARSAGCDLFLAKPCFPDDLLKAVRWTLAWARRGRPMLKASSPIMRVRSLRAVAGYQLAHN